MRSQSIIKIGPSATQAQSVGGRSLVKIATSKLCCRPIRACVDKPALTRSRCMPSRAALPLDRTAEHQECIWVTTALAKFTSEPQLGSTRQEQIRSMAGQDQGWPGSRPWLIRIVAGRDQGWSGPWLIRIMAGRDSGWAGSRQDHAWP